MFSEELKNISWEETTERIAGMTETDVRRALSKSHLNVGDFMALISPAAEPYLETMARLSRHYTEERFGRTMSMFIPLYITNACTNSCVYCGFHRENPMARTILTPEQIENEYRAIKKLAPFENILLVTGEHPAKAGVPYLAKAIDIAKRYFSNIKIEVMPLEAEEYKELTRHGLNGVICFQETYHKDNYQLYHPRGMKSRFEWRCDGFDRMGQAGVHSIGMGVLIGLEKEWRTDITMMAHHLRYLQKHYWRTKYSINFPRMRPAQNEGFQPNCIMTDRQLAQATFAMRIFDHDVDISYSTREPAYIRDNMCTLGVTTMSAESKVNPGGYHTYPQALEQFTVSDERTAKEIELRLKQLGREPVWKDWDASFDRVSSLSSLPVILLTLPDFFEGETDIVNKLFAGTLSLSSATTMANAQCSMANAQCSMVNGPWRLHLRKPEATREQLAGWIEEIEPRFRNRIVLHDHHDLALQYGLGGIHLNRRNASLPHNLTKSTKPTGFTLSRSCHTIEEVKACQDDFDYVFLSPIFDSISKQGYKSAFSKEELAAARDILSKNVYALGGVTFERLRTVQDLGFHGAAIMGGFWK